MSTTLDSKQIGNVDLLKMTDQFEPRHNGPSDRDVQTMLETIGVSSLKELMDQVVPDSIRMSGTLNIPEAASETEALEELRELAQLNRVYRSYIGMGYSGTLTPAVILRNVLENPGWYTQYTPYQAEIAQGRMEALLNFQTVICDLTGMEVANSSLLDEPTAAAEAMALSFAARKRGHTGTTFLVSELCHPQTIDTVIGRAEPLGINVVVGSHDNFEFDENVFGVLLQYPATDGQIFAYDQVCEKAHAGDALVTVAADIMSLVLLRAPVEFGADIVVGSTQRFGVPLGYGGPHAAYFATKDAYRRLIPGRIIGMSKDAHGKPALRLALQTREQHIRREKATSNICTAQVLLAVMASMYCVYHGPGGLRRIANRIRLLTLILANALESRGYSLSGSEFFDTIKIVSGPVKQAAVQSAALAAGINLRYFDDGGVGISLDEATTIDDLADLFIVFGLDPSEIFERAESVKTEFGAASARSTDFLTNEIFNKYHSETEMVRYLFRLQSRDLSLVHSMIPLGSCTMKLNATTEMIPVTWPEFANIHPFAPTDQTVGYAELFRRLEDWLSDITGFDATSLQPNAGSQGEYAGLLVIRAFHTANGDTNRNVCLIPSSAHGTNPASAVMAGMKVVVVKCDDDGNVDLADLKTKIDANADQLAALMITYPSTHGVFETEIKQICDLVHQAGGQVYMDGANMNAQVGLTSPGIIGADVCHLNLHKTFCIPHGGGGPGMGPICVKSHLAPYLPGHDVIKDTVGGTNAIRAISAAPWGSAAILPISYAYIRMMGAEGLTNASKISILNANYIATKLQDSYPVLYRGETGRVAHECILDTRDLKKSASVDDIAKRLMDYGFHAPTMSWPVAGTLMIEPTESESLAELDRFCEAMSGIRAEIADIENGDVEAENSALHHAPHTAEIIAGPWDRRYSREMAAFPLPWVRDQKFWPTVSRVDNAYGDRNLVCTCDAVEDYAE